MRPDHISPVNEVRASRPRIWAAVLIFVSCLAAAWSQQSDPTTIQGRVSNASGAPVASAPVHLEHAGAQAAETSTNAEGEFTFRNVPPGEYTVSAENAGQPRASQTIHTGQAGTQRVDLVIAESKSPPADAMEFADDPKFTVAAVTDWTAAGGHGSDAVLRTSEALNRETLSLKSAKPHAAETTDAWRNQESALRAAQASGPDNFAANHNLGEFYLNAERFDQAVPPLLAAYNTNPGDFKNEYDLALALKGKGEYAKARDHIEKLGARRDSADVHLLQGELDEKLGDPLAAVHEFERAVRLDPTEQNYFEWGSELLLHRAVWQARDVFAAGVKAYPKSGRMLTALGAALFAGALYDQAAERLCAASDLNPADPEPYTFMGKIEISAPNPLPCIEQKLARFVAQKPGDPLASYFYAMALWKQKGSATDPPTLAHVEDLLHTAVKIDSQCSDAWLQLGVLQSTRGDYQKAIEFYATAIQANPQMSEAHYRLGIAYDRIGDKVKSAEQLRLHDEIEKQQAAAVEKQRREVKQFRVVVDGQKSDSNP
jgi:tetratricopeptide (TPR) repeat protein